MMDIPFLDLRSLHKQLAEEILEQWRALLLDASFIGGKAVLDFETHFASYCNARSAIAVNSGTTALRFALMALGVKPGDEIITVPNTFFATMEAIELLGARTVFCDIDPKTRTMDPASLAGLVTSRTVGIIPVHLYGMPADMDPIIEIALHHSLFVLEDACQAHGAEYKGKRCGSFGVAAAFSFYPGKNLGACGEGGCITTNDIQFEAKVRQLRDHGQSQRYFHDIVGDNGRLDSIQCAALDIKLKYLPLWTDARRAVANKYGTEITNRGIPVIVPYEPSYARSVYHIYSIEVENRDIVQKKLNAAGIGTGLHYPLPLHLQKASSHLGYGIGSFPHSEYLAGRLLSIPMDPFLTEQQILTVIDQL